MSTDLLERYLAVNSRYGCPFIFKLTQRGFYSEVNNLLNAMIFGLAKGRRLIVDESDFEGLKWSDFFTSSLPTAPQHVIDRVPEPWVIDGSRTDQFWRIWKFVVKRHRSHFPLWIPSMSMFGGIESIKRTLTDMIFTPHVDAEMLSSPYAAFHIRRGDKIEGSVVAPVPEAMDTSPRVYIDRLRQEAPDISKIFVMTDDYTVIETLQTIAPEYQIITFCTQEERGYRQLDHSALSPARKGERLKRLLEETQIAAGSDIFLGGFKSNVARFVVLRHINPKRCFSVDSEKRWNPG